jgi:hypothetical protein
MLMPLAFTLLFLKAFLAGILTLHFVSPTHLSAC